MTRFIAEIEDDLGYIRKFNIPVPDLFIKQEPAACLNCHLRFHEAISAKLMKLIITHRCPQGKKKRPRVITARR